MLGLRIGKVIGVHYELNTVDVFLENGGGIMYNLPVLSTFAGSSVGLQELPILKTVPKRGSRVILSGSDSEPTDNLFHLETLDPGKEDLDDPVANYAYAIIGMPDEQYGKVQPVCLGFVFPERNQVLFNPDEPPTTVSAAVQTAVSKLKGGLIHRTSSDVYWTVDADGNAEWSHPNGSFIRIAESPTLKSDGVIHVDLTNANNKSQEVDVDDVPTGSTTNSSWNTSLKKGTDGQKANADRRVYGHIELVTDKGVVLIDIEKETGNLTIKTPVDVSNATAANNQLTIIAGGNAIIESVQGDVKLQAVNGNVSVEGKNNVTVQTDQAARNSVILAPNAGSQDNLVFLHKLISKFNNHQHVCNHTGKLSSSPTVSIDDTDGTSITIAG